MPVGVVIIDENESERARIAEQISRDVALCVVGSYATYALAELARDGNSPEVIVTESDLPTITAIAKHWPRTKVLILTCDSKQNTVLAALSAGASGYLLKGEPASRLSHAIWRVCNGGSILSPAVMDVVVKSFNGRLPLMLPLTDLQTEVLRKRGRGLSYKTIESDLGLSKSALKKCVREILRKTFSDSTAEAVFRKAGTWA